MGKPRIVIADEDYNYIIPLQLRFIEEMFDRIELEVITDKTYFNKLMSYPQTVDILIVSEAFYSDMLMKHDIKCGFIMMESWNSTNMTSFTSIYKYTNIKEIFSVILGKAGNIANADSESKNDPQLVVITSASGGVGKTSLAMGLASVLSRHLKKVLYVNIDYLQNFQVYLNNGLPISDNQLYMKLSMGESNSFAMIRHLIRREEFDYVPPFKGAILSLGISHATSLEIAEQALESKEYDYVIIDADSTFDEEKMKLMTDADRIIFVVTQTDPSVLAMNRFLENTEIAEKDKILYVCNQFEQGKRNALVSGNYKLKFMVNEYIEYMEDFWERRNDKFASNAGIQKIAMSII